MLTVVIISFHSSKLIEERLKEIEDNIPVIIIENSRNFKVNYIKSKYNFDKKTRLTLDFKEDLILFNKIFKYFKDKDANFTLEDVLNLLKKQKNLININNFLTAKFKKIQINTELNI